MHVPDELRGVLISTPDTLSGDIRFRGTRVPVRALLDTLAGGSSIDDFMEGWPGVAREQAEAVVRWEQHRARQEFGLETV